MKKTRRTSRVGENVRDALVEVFRHDLKDIDLGFISITGVDVSPDLQYAKVFLSGLKEDETKALISRLQDMRGRVRHFLGKRIRLRYTPELDFRYDEAPERGGRIESLLAELNRQKTDDDDHNES
ncbi:MAG TPA: 30S ribosome-binding factor RbfA [Thermoanaerobaculia bacterium]|nr:30S ribosome-binding factor RbfA [Thermoanaerobaculia bacterium]